MRAAVALRNIVCVTEHVFRIAVVPLQRCLDAYVVFHRCKMKYRRMNDCFVSVEVIDKGLDTTFVFKHFFLLGSFINKTDTNTRVQKRQLAQSSRENFVMELDVGECSIARLEPQRCAGSFRVTNNGQRRGRLTMHVFLLVGLAVAMNGKHQVLGQRINDRNANAVQAPADLVRIVVKFSARVQDGHDDLCRRAPLFRVQVNRDAAPVIADGDRLVGVDRHRNCVAVAR